MGPTPSSLKSDQFLLLVFCHQMHIWTLTPKEMVLTAHVTYQNKEIFEEIHTQVHLTVFMSYLA